MSKKIEQLKTMWNNYKQPNIEKAIEEHKIFLEKYPKEGLENLSLNNYTNIKENAEVEYFTNWIERKTENCGKFRTASSFAYGVYKVNHNNIKDKSEKDFAEGKYKSSDEKGLKNEKDFKKKYITSEKAEEYFNKHVKIKLSALVNFADIDDIKPIDINYARKVAYMYNPKELIPIYKKEVLESIATFFEIKDFEPKSYKATDKILNKFCETFEIKEETMDFKLTQKISSFLWEYFGKSVSFDSKNIIYYGAPGTGKTYTVHNAVRQKVLLDGNNINDVAIFTQFHPSFGYEDFIEGLKPYIDNGATGLKLTNGIFKKFCMKAMNNLIKSKKGEEELKKYYFVADEINRAELSSVFGELLSCLEESKRINLKNCTENNISIKDDSLLIDTQYSYLINDKKNAVFTTDDGEYKFGVPSNVYFIGTMNDIDRSIDNFDLALRRRFTWERMDCDYSVIAHYDKLSEVVNLTDENGYIDKCKALNKFISIKLGLGKSYEIGHSYFMDIKIKKKNEIAKINMQKLFDKKLKPLIEEYLRGTCSQIELESHLKEADKIFKI